MRIGFLDSGLGGLTILRAVTHVLPQYDYVFYGDTANLPYGDRSEEEVYNFTLAGVRALFADGCVLIIIACNTASAETLRRIQDTVVRGEYPNRRVLGVIVPTVEVLLAAAVKHTLLLATQRTVSSGKYDRELQACGSTQAITAVAAPQLVRLIEAGDIETAVNHAAKAIQDTRDKKPDIDSCVLGCTHYTLLKNQLRELFPNFTFFSQDEIIPEKLADYLNDHTEIAETLTTTSTRLIKLTDANSTYDQIVTQMLGGSMLMYDRSYQKSTR